MKGVGKKMETKKASLSLVHADLLNELGYAVIYKNGNILLVKED